MFEISSGTLDVANYNFVSDVFSSNLSDDSHDFWICVYHDVDTFSFHDVLMPSLVLNLSCFLKAMKIKE